MKDIFQENNQNTEYKTLKLKEFRSFIYSVIKAKFSKKTEQEEEKDKIQNLISENGGDFFGKMFYLVLKRSGEDIDLTCETLFSDYVYPGLSKPQKDQTKLATFISGITLSDGELAEAIGTNPTHFSRSKNHMNHEDLFAFEVYALAKISNVKPSQLFNYFYGDGEQPLVGV
ncbi:hypothetical protein FAZ19_21795 [Sphingobacterium alkalisoli]|uniref:Uncharacterized protein n=1 Tax=Sphingobacterium alkalisoli TaxID=1874115 RepID=A0A4U0GRE2_9SPHI|nr:hypothetical protein [Sphingobacterium alkalisoli]TJY61531.1 hypothetical protein FAZ19_21795 [Sphingobacterium alkalisoli]GGH29814.1 hypothetical protein GCM10011418_41410 [Sphingobacterium alkalisoli]